MIKRSFIDTDFGQMHYRSEGRGTPVLLLHQTPRSSDEYLKVIPLLAKHNLRAIGVDTISFGDSDKKPRIKDHSIQNYAKATVSFADAMNIEKFNLVGHHTGAVIAFEIAVSYPRRVGKLVLSNCPFIDREAQIRMDSRRGLDRIELENDGAHIIDLWNGRKAFYPENRPDLLTRFIIDALKAGSSGVYGHRAVKNYNMEKKFVKISCPTLLICGTKDPFAYPDLHRLAEHIPSSQVKEIKGGTVAMIDQMPDQVARVLVKFFRGR